MSGDSTLKKLDINQKPSPKRDQIELAKQWICIMLYPSARNFEYFVREGCRVMIYGSLGFDELRTTLTEMVKEETIVKDSSGNYSLTLRGLFNVKQNSIVPVLNLTDNEEYVRAFIEKNQANCDLVFLNEIIKYKSDSDRESVIINYAKNNYHKLAPTIVAITKFLLDHGNTSPT